MCMTYEEKMDRIKHYRPIDDAFFEVVAKDIYVSREILRTIMEKPKLNVKEVVVQSSERNLYGRSVRLDALCTLKKGVKANIEVQRANDDDHIRRVRFNASLVTVRESESSDRFKDIIELYVIFVTEYDLFKQGKTVYHIHKRVDETGKVINDGLHEIYVNAAIGDGSDTAALMKCFMSEYVDDPKFPALSKRVKILKDTETGRSEVISVMNDIEERAVKAERLRQIKILIGRGKTPEEIVELSDYSQKEVKEARQELLISLSQSA